MLYEFQQHTAHQLGDVYPQSLRLRKQMFVDGQGWTGPDVYMNMEFDQFDTPTAYYLAGIDDAGAVRATCRMLFCDRPYMLASLWSDELARDRILPATKRAAEGTRTGVDMSIPRDEQWDWWDQLFIGGPEWALHHGVEQYTFVTYTHVARMMKERFGLPIELLGEPHTYEGGEFVAGYYPISQDLIDEQRERAGIDGQVLVLQEETSDAYLRQAVAS